MNAQPTIIHIPLSQLTLSPRNARKTGGTDVEDLAASIHAHNLLQNLTVTPGANDDSYQVVAGGRRLAAMQLLRDRGQLAADFSVPCKLIDDDDVALEASTAENTLREAMHPADQFDAFRAMVDAGKSIDDVAAHFGVAPIVVKQRLKLANVNPKLVQIYREGGMQLDQLQALALTDNHEAQRQAWGTKNDWERNARSLREKITQRETSSDSALAKFVGLQAYEDAGGPVRRDLFSPRNEAWLQDTALLDKLAMDKLEAIAQAERDAGWSWAEAHLSMDYAQRAEYPKHSRPDGEPQFATPEDEARMKQIEARLKEIEQAEWNDLEDDAEDALTDERLRLEEEYDQIDGRMIEQWPDATKAAAGVLVYLLHDGVNIERGRLKPGQKVANDGEITGKAKADKPAAPKKPQLSQDMLERLDLHRAAACRQLLVEQPALAVQLLTAQLVLQLFFTHDSTFSVRATNEHKALANNRFPDVVNADARKVLSDSIKGIVTVKKAGDVLPWIQTLNASQLQQLQALCAAVSLDNLRGRDLGAAALTLGLDMAQWWQADAERYTGNVPKALTLEAVTEAKGKDAATALATLKKPDLIAEAAKQLAGTGWLPKPLRSPGYTVGAKPAVKATPAKKKTTAKKKSAKKASGKKAKAA